MFSNSEAWTPSARWKQRMCLHTSSNPLVYQIQIHHGNFTNDIRSINISTPTNAPIFNTKEPISGKNWGDRKEQTGDNVASWIMLMVCSCHPNAIIHCTHLHTSMSKHCPEYKWNTDICKKQAYTLGYMFKIQKMRHASFSGTAMQRDQISVSVLDGQRGHAYFAGYWQKQTSSLL